MVILSCGHREDNFNRHYRIMTKEWTREHTRAVGYRTVCPSCYKQYQKEGALLHSDKEAIKWLKE